MLQNRNRVRWAGAAVLVSAVGGGCGPRVRWAGRCGPSCLRWAGAAVLVSGGRSCGPRVRWAGALRSSSLLVTASH